MNPTHWRIGDDGIVEHGTPGDPVPPGWVPIEYDECVLTGRERGRMTVLEGAALTVTDDAQFRSRTRGIEDWSKFPPGVWKRLYVPEALAGDAIALCRSFGSGVELLAIERQRQYEVEGHTDEQDDAWTDGQLAAAAQCYLINRQIPPGMVPRTPHAWPFAADQWKPAKDPIRNLVKAGALIAAEIARLRRATKPKPGPCAYPECDDPGESTGEGWGSVSVAAGQPHVLLCPVHNDEATARLILAGMQAMTTKDQT